MKKKSVYFFLFSILFQMYAYASDEQKNKISHVEVKNKGAQRDILIDTSQVAVFNVFKQDNPHAIVIDVVYGSLDPNQKNIDIEDGILSQVSFRQFEGPSSGVARIMIGLDRPDVKYDVITTKTGILAKIALKTIDGTKVPVVSIPPAPSQKKKINNEIVQITAVQYESTQDIDRIHIVCSRIPDKTVSILDNPERIVVDLEKAQFFKKIQDMHWNARCVRDVRFGKHPDKARLVFDLASKECVYSSVQRDDGIEFLVYRQEHAQHEMIDFSIENNASDNAKIVIHRTIAEAFQALTKPEWAQIQENLYLLELPFTIAKNKIPEIVDTKTSENLIQSITSSPANPKEQTIRFLIQTQENVQANLKQEKSDFILNFQRNATSIQEETVFASSPPQERILQTYEESSKSKKTITVDMKDADILNVIRLLSDVSGENIVASDEVRGKITLRMREVPWEQALETILKTKGYDKVKSNGILRIAPAEAIQKERENELSKIKTQELTEETQIKIVPVNYATAADIVEQMKHFLSARGSIQTDTRTNTLIIQEVKSNLEKIVALTKKLDKPTPQVLIQARIVEAQSNHLRELGVQWGGIGQATAKSGNPTGLLFPGDVIASGAADDRTLNQTSGVSTPARYAVNLPAAVGSGLGGGIGFVFGSAGGNQLLNLRLSAMEANGNGKIISSPRVTTLDNKTAKIAQGLDIPISVVSAAGTNTRFIPANLELEVTPHVTNDGSVVMKIKTSKNEADFAQKGAAGDPTIVKKFAETEVLVKDGETTVIGGIYTRTTSETLAEVPFLSKIPVLGLLFKNKRKEDKRAELLVFISPRIINREEALNTESIEP